MAGCTTRFLTGEKLLTLLFSAYIRSVNRRLINYKTLIIQFQSGIMMKPKRKLFASFDKISGFTPEDDIKKLGFEHFLFPGIVHLNGLFLSVIVFLCEICIQYKYK